jgi:hypothetical protein
VLLISCPFIHRRAPKIAREVVLHQSFSGS